MTNEELKKKIESIIRNAKRDFAYCVPEEWAVKVLADALIAAGIGDVKDLQAQVDALEMTNMALQAGYDDAEKDRLYWVDKYKEAEHRAEVAEKALRNAVRAQDCLSCTAFLDDRCSYMNKNGCKRNSNQCINNILAQAEKEFGIEVEE